MSESYPIGLYYTSGGQITGIKYSALVIFQVSQLNITEILLLKSTGLLKVMELLESLSLSEHLLVLMIIILTSSAVCSGTTYPEIIGNQLVLDQGFENVSIPIFVTAAQKAQWTKGSCIGG